MYRTWTRAQLEAELTELAREMRAADPGDLPGLQALFCRVETELRGRR